MELLYFIIIFYFQTDLLKGLCGAFLVCVFACDIKRNLGRLVKRHNCSIYFPFRDVQRGSVSGISRLNCKFNASMASMSSSSIVVVLFNMYIKCALYFKLNLQVTLRYFRVTEVFHLRHRPVHTC